MRNRLIALACLFHFLLLPLTQLSAQQWGAYTLYSENGSSRAYLIDTTNAVYHQWTMSGAPTGYSTYLLPDQSICRSVQTQNPFFTGGGVHGRIQKVDWNGNVTWDFTHSTSDYCLHHDHCVLPNGNVLMISYERKTASEATAAGCTQNMVIHSEKVIEVQPTGLNTGNIVWEWHLWDHLVQDQYPSLANYHSSIVANPQLLDINYQTTEDWIHMNGIDYNDSLDQIVLSSHNLNEVWIIDHSTTTAEAASHAGGNSGKGGDFLYRWGNPATYQAATPGTNVFDVCHDAHWIPSDCPNAGRLVVFNNDWSSFTQSSVIQWDIPYNGYNYDLNPGPAYGPATYANRRGLNGFNSNMGNSQQLPNGNTLICMAMMGTIYEIGPNGNVLWTKNLGGSCSQAFRYTDCYVNGGGTPPTLTTSVSDDTICRGDTIQLSVIPTGGSGTYTYRWSSNPNSMTSTVQSPTANPVLNSNFYVTVTDNGCSSVSSVHVTVISAPTPSITVSNDTLFSSPGLSYQWYLALQPISGATSQYYVPTQSGAYTVVITDSTGCKSAYASSVNYVYVGLEDAVESNWRIYPNPSAGRVNIQRVAGVAANYTASVTDAQGRRVMEVENATVLVLQDLPQGIYLVSIHQGEQVIVRQKISIIR